MLTKEILLNNLSESLDKIPTKNKLYHRTNIEAIINILKEKKLKGFKYISNVETKIKGHLDPYLQIKYPEIATARKATFSTIDRTNIANDERLSLGIGAFEIELYKDRVRTVRGVNIEPIDEYRAREGEERIVLKDKDYIPVDPKYMIIRIKPTQLIKDYNNNLVLNFDNNKKVLEKLKELKILISSNNDLFEKDHNFRYFAAWLDDKIKSLSK